MLFSVVVTRIPSQKKLNCNHHHDIYGFEQCAVIILLRWGQRSADVQMKLESNRWLHDECCHFCNLSVLHERRTMATHTIRTLRRSHGEQLHLLTFRPLFFNFFFFLHQRGVRVCRGGQGGVGWVLSGGTWGCSFVGNWVRLEDTAQAAGPDTGTLTCYCPGAFKHRLVWSGTEQRAQMKANIVNVKEENDYLQGKMSPWPL